MKSVNYTWFCNHVVHTSGFVGFLYWISPCVKMASSYAVCMTAKVNRGGTVAFSRVATLSLTTDFASVFAEYNVDDKYQLDSVLVSSGPNGPWQNVDENESTSVLRNLLMRHILFSVSEKEPVPPTLTSAFDVLMASQKEPKLPAKKKNRDNIIYIYIYIYLNDVVFNHLIINQNLFESVKKKKKKKNDRPTDPKF